MGIVSNNTNFASKGRTLALSGNETLEDECLYIGVGGNVEVILQGDSSSIILIGVPTGTFLPLMIKQVNTAGTTATDIIALK